MKFIMTLIFALSASSTDAKMYKCKENGITSYQEKPCASKGSEFELRKDISVEQHNKAVTKLNQEIAIADKKKQIAKEQAGKERLIHAQEMQAEASFENAIQTKRQTDAFDALKKNRNNLLYPTPYQNTFKHRILPHPSQTKPAHKNQIKLSGKNESKLPNKKPTIYKKSMYKK